MISDIVSIRANDRGHYHDKPVQFQLCSTYIEDEGLDEQLRIRYGGNKVFLNAGVYHASAPTGHVYVSKAGVGGLMDITLTQDEFIAILKKVKMSDEGIKRWETIFENRNITVKV